MDSLGLTAGEVRRMLGVEHEPIEIEPKRYLSKFEQQRIRRRMLDHLRFVYVRYEEGYHPALIALMLCVSEECVRSRLRDGGFFTPESRKRRRPKEAPNRPGISRISLCSPRFEDKDSGSSP